MITIETPITTAAQARAWDAMQKQIAAEFTADYATLHVHNFYHAGAGVWRAWVKTVKTWGAVAHVPVQVSMYPRKRERVITSQREGYGPVHITVDVLPQTDTQRKVLAHAIAGLQAHSDGSNYVLTARIHKMEYRAWNKSWRVYVERDYALIEGGDANKFPGAGRPTRHNIDSIVHSERGVLQYASGPYRSYQTETQPEALKRERGY